jgi:putative RecB family exonuclease
MLGGTESIFPRSLMAVRDRAASVRLSPGQVKTHTRCPLQYRWRYIDRLQLPERPVIDDATMLGLLAHAALERVYRWAQRERYRGPLGTAELLRRALATVRDQAERGVTDIGRDHLLVDDAAELVVGYLTDRTVDGSAILAVEELLRLDLGDVTVGGRFDRVERKGTDVLVVDYKTGGYLPDTAGLAEDLQALVYLAAAAQRWPWAGRVTFRIDNLRHSGNVAIGYERGEIPALIGALAQRFRAAAERLHAAPWPAREGDHCRWCPFAAAYCPAKGRTPPVHAYAPGDDQPLSDAEGELSCPPRS